MVWRQTVQFLEMIRFSHTLFALPFALLAVLLACAERAGNDGGLAWRWRELAGVLLAMVFARSAAMAFNRIADRKFDAENPRTKMRHLVTGALTLRVAVTFAALTSVGFVASTALFLPNRWPLVLAIPVLAFLMGYSLAKRFTSLTHFWLGAALGLAPVCAWIALTGTVSWTAALLGGAVLTWVVGFDLLYSCQDATHDREAGLRSVPAKIGVAASLRLAAACHVAMVGLLLAIPAVYGELGAVYLFGVAGIAVLLAYEHLLVRPDDLSRVNLAFFHVNWIVSVALLLVSAVDLLVW